MLEVDVLQDFDDRLSEKKLVADTRLRLAVHTGSTSIHSSNLELMRSNLRGNVTELRRENKLFAEEADALYNMIDSPDEENLVVAQTIIEIKI